MKFLEGLLTKQERTALAFVVGVSLFGIALLNLKDFNSSQAPVAVREKVSVNRADAAELASLPRIGPVLAKRIVEDRQRHGPYLVAEDLRRVKGVTPKTLDKFKGMIRFD